MMEQLRMQTVSREDGRHTNHQKGEQKVLIANNNIMSVNYNHNNITTENMEGGFQKQTEIKASLIPGAGKGRFALEDLPKGTIVRIQTIGSKELQVFHSTQDLQSIDDGLLINYCHTLPTYSCHAIKTCSSPPARVFLNAPGMYTNHGSGIHETIEYRYTATHKYTIAKRDILKGEELLQDYRYFRKVDWFEDYLASFQDGRLSLRQLGLDIELQLQSSTESSSEEETEVEIDMARVLVV